MPDFLSAINGRPTAMATRHRQDTGNPHPAPPPLRASPCGGGSQSARVFRQQLAFPVSDGLVVIPATVATPATVAPPPPVGEDRGGVKYCCRRCCFGGGSRPTLRIYIRLSAQGVCKRGFCTDSEVAASNPTPAIPHGAGANRADFPLPRRAKPAAGEGWGGGRGIHVITEAKTASESASSCCRRKSR